LCDQGPDTCKVSKCAWGRWTIWMSGKKNPLVIPWWVQEGYTVFLFFCETVPSAPMRDCLFADNHNHYATHFRCVEIEFPWMECIHEWCAVNKSLARVQLRKDTETETWLNIVFLKSFVNLSWKGYCVTTHIGAKATACLFHCGVGAVNVNWHCKFLVWKANLTWRSLNRKQHNTTGHVSAQQNSSMRHSKRQARAVVYSTGHNQSKRGRSTSGQ